MIAFDVLGLLVVVLVAFASGLIVGVILREPDDGAAP